jgi:hypothetical protein
MLGDDGNMLRCKTPPITSREIMGVSIMLNGNNLLQKLDERVVRVSAIQSLKQVNAMTAEQLSRRWCIGLGKAKMALQVTAQ